MPLKESKGAPVDQDLAKVTRDIMKAIVKRRALPMGYAVFFVIARAPDGVKGVAGAMTVASVPPQEPDVVKVFLEQAAAQLTPEMTTHVASTRKPSVPTGTA
jgi:hypothetical protein